MYVEIEKSGVMVVKGTVQIRFSMFLEEKDYGYEKHHAYIPIIPKGTVYDGPKNEFGGITRDDMKKWFDGFPHEWRDNPFHNHFIYVTPETSDEDIMDIGESFLHEAYIKWSSDEKLDLINPEMPKFKTQIEPLFESMCETKVESITLSSSELNTYKRVIVE